MSQTEGASLTPRQEAVVTLTAAYVSQNQSANTRENLINLMSNFGAALDSLVTPIVEEPAHREPAVNPKKSITSEYLICLDDGRKFKSLKRHIKSKYGMTPEDYRRYWNLPDDYPMTAPAYSEARSRLARQIGLGSKGRTGAKASNKKAATAAPVEATAAE